MRKKKWRKSKIPVFRFSDILVVPYRVVTAKNPCNSCLVKACCSNDCNKKLEYMVYIARLEDLFPQYARK